MNELNDMQWQLMVWNYWDEVNRVKWMKSIEWMCGINGWMTWMKQLNEWMQLMQWMQDMNEWKHDRANAMHDWLSWWITNREELTSIGTAWDEWMTWHVMTLNYMTV